MTSADEFRDDVILGVGRTPEDRARNAELLAGFDHAKHPGGLTGYAGQDLQRVLRLDRTSAAVRTRVGPRGNYKAGMTKRDDGTIVLAVCRFGADYHSNPENRKLDIVVYESTDGGESWDEIARPPFFGKEPSLTATADGAVLLTAQYADYRPGAKPGGAMTARSTDGGRTWDCVNMISEYRYPRNVVVEEDGTLLYLTSDTEMENLALFRSRDHGRTWDVCPAEVHWQAQERSTFAEISVIRLAGGRLLAAFRRRLPPGRSAGVSMQDRGHCFGSAVLTESEDDGRTWSPPRSFTDTGEVQVILLQLADGRLLATYTNYHLPFGVCAVVSEDDGASWDLDHPMQLSLSWTGPTGCHGWPVTLELDNGTLVTCYASNPYAGQDPPTVVCEAVRWRLPQRSSNE